MNLTVNTESVPTIFNQQIVQMAAHRKARTEVLWNSDKASSQTL